MFEKYAENRDNGKLESLQCNGKNPTSQRDRKSETTKKSKNGRGRGGGGEEGGARGMKKNNPLISVSQEVLYSSFLILYPIAITSDV